MMNKTEKLQKVLAHIGLGSRREIETWIEAGRVKINHLIAKTGARVAEYDKIEVDGRLIRWQFERPPQPRVLIYHKPEGEMCTRADPEGRPTVFEHLPKIYKQRWLSIGRLDVNTSGLLIFTTDGELANRLMHPSFEIEREYAVRILGRVDDQTLTKLRRGVQLEDGLANFAQVREAGGEGANHWYHVVIKEGRKREVRRLWESQGLTVSRLIRVRYGVITLPSILKRGKFMDLEPEQCTLLYEAAGLTSPFVVKKRVTRKTQEETERVKPEKPAQTRTRSTTKSTAKSTDKFALRKTRY